MIAAMILARQRWTCFSLLLLLFGFGVSIRFTNYQIAYIGLALTALIFLIRIPAVYIGFGRTTCVRDASLAAIMSPKDLAAVVLASMPRERQLPGGETVQSVTYGIVFLSIVFTSCSVS